MDTVPVTPEGLQKLKDELAAVEDKIPGVTERLSAAREQGDLGENAEFHAAREEISFINSQISKLQKHLAMCRVVDPKDLPKDMAALGARVTLEDLTSGREVTYMLVGGGEADPVKRKILTTSPVGAALLRKKVGDEVEVQAPRGTIRYKIRKIEYS
jgi:transcription elongation factor GreA